MAGQYLKIIETRGNFLSKYFVLSNNSRAHLHFYQQLCIELLPKLQPDFGSEPFQIKVK
jgi:hypothetical protein